MEFKCEYTDLICPVCGCEKVIHYFNYNICENCHYTVLDSDGQVPLYNINSSGTSIAYGDINLEALLPNTLTITNCELIKIHHKELDIEFEFDIKKIENIDTIEINGHRFIREKK